MSYRLRVAPVVSSSRLPSALSPGEAAAHGAFDDGVLTVDDEATAAELAEYPNVERLDGADPEGSGSPDTCEAVVQSTGDVCGRDLPCPYHSDE